MLRRARSLPLQRRREAAYADHTPLALESLEDRRLLSALTWSPGVNLPSARAGASAIETGGAILVVGGGTTTTNLLSSGSSAWSAAAALDLPRYYAGLASTGSQYLVYGGNTGGTALEEALTYDPYNIDNVQDAAILHTPRTQFGYAGDGAFPYAIGGLNGGSVLATVERYNVATDSWSYTASLPQARFDFPAVDDGAGHIYTFGGATANNATSVSNTVYRYTVATNTWQTMAAMPVATRDSAAVLASNGRIYVLGGSSAAGAIATVQSYDPAANTWTSETDLPAARTSAAAVGDALGRIEVIGGYDASHVAVNTVWVSQQLNVPDTPPAITSTAPATVNVGSLYTYQVVATGNPQPTFSLTVAPSGMSVNPTSGLITWTPTVAQAGLNNVTVRATNVAGFDERPFTVRAYSPAPTAPTGLQVTGTTTNTVSLTWNPSTDGIGVAGYRVYRVTHTGFHGIQTVYTQYADVPGTSATVNVPLPGYGYTFTVAAYNASGSQSGYSARVTATTQSAPTFIGPATVGVIANHPLAFNLSASGNPATFSYSAINVPAGMTVNPTTGLVSWTPTDANVGSSYYTFSISNGVGVTSAVVNVNVSANLPNVTYTPGPTALATQPYSVQFSQVSDPYNTAPVTYALVAGPAGASIHPTSGLLSWTPGTADIGTANFTVRATNYAGSRDTSLSVPVTFASAAQNVTVSNVTTTSAVATWQPPAFTALPIQGYHITASYVTRSGRFNTVHTLNFSATGATTVNLTGLPTSKTITVSVSAFDAANRDGLAGRTSFSTATATPTIAIAGGPYTYDAAAHGVSATARGVGGVVVSGSFTYTYNGLDTLPVEPGTYAVEAIFNSSDPYYADTVGVGSLVINPAQPAIVLDATTFTYDGAPHALSATAYALDGSTPVSGTFSYSYEGSPTPPTNPGLYAVAITFTSADPRYATTTINDSLRIVSTGTTQPTLTLNGGPFVYNGAPRPLTAVAFQTNGTTPLAGTFSTFTYNGSTTVPANAGTYAVAGAFYSRNPNYADKTVNGTLTISRAAPAVSIASSYVYNGGPQTANAVAYGVDGITPVSGSFSLTYNGSNTAPTNAGTYAVIATFTSADPNYTNASAAGSMIIAKATPYIQVTGGGYLTFDGATHAGTAVAYAVDGVTPLAGAPVIHYRRWDAATNAYVSSGTPLHAGTFLIDATYTSTNPNYLSATVSESLYIVPATPNVVISGGPFDYDGNPHGATVAVTGVNGTTPVAGSTVVTYDGAPAVPSDGGVHTVQVAFTSANPDYANTSGTGELVIYPAAHLAPDETYPWLMNLVWTGSPGADEVQFFQIDATTVQVIVLRQNGIVSDTDQSFAGVTGMIVADGRGGDDTIDASAITGLFTQLSGGAGKDLIRGGNAGGLLFGDTAGVNAAAQDTIFGGAGDDTIYGDSNADGGEGAADIISAGDGNDVIYADGGMGGVAAGDTIDGGAGDDVIFADGAEGGDDVITTGDGNNWVDAGPGNDSVTGGSGNDVLIGGDGAEGSSDTLIGGAGRDILIGDMGNVVVAKVAGGADLLVGGAGEDLILAGAFLPADGNALAAIQAEWTSARSYAQRVANISGVGAGPRDNGDYFLSLGVNVFNDRTASLPVTSTVVDQVLGGADMDWLLFDASEDLATDVAAGETTVNLRTSPLPP